jgi:predicted transcriptional regulator
MREKASREVDDTDNTLVTPIRTPPVKLLILNCGNVPTGSRSYSDRKFNDGQSGLNEKPLRAFLRLAALSRHNFRTFTTPVFRTVRQCRTGGVDMSTLTIRLDAKLEKALDRLARASGKTKSEIAREALKREVAVTRFRELRRKALPFAEAQGLVTDEDIFQVVS